MLAVAFRMGGRPAAGRRKPASFAWVPIRTTIRPDPPAATTPVVSCNSPHAARCGWRRPVPRPACCPGCSAWVAASLIVPALVLIASLPMRRAVATSLWVIAIISVIGLLSHIIAGHRLDVGITVGFVLGGLAGMALGIVVSKRIAGPTPQNCSPA